MRRRQRPLTGEKLTSNRRKRMKTTVAGGEKSVQTFQSPWTQVMKCDTPRNRLNTGQVNHCTRPVFRIHIFLGLTETDPLVSGTDPDPDPSIIKEI